MPLDLEQIVESLLVGRLLYDLTVSGLPAGAALTHGEANIDGSWTLSARDLRAGPVAVELPQTFQGSLILAFAAMTAGPFGDIELRMRWTTVEVESAEPI